MKKLTKKGGKQLQHEYDSTVQQVISCLRQTPKVNHFKEIRELIDRLEAIDLELSSSNMVRSTIDIPDDQDI